MIDGSQPVTTLDALRSELRVSRGFDPVEVLESKVGRLNEWFRGERLDTAVVGVSGGIDSAVVLGLLRRAAGVPASPIRDVIAVSIPIEGLGATGQARAAARARLLGERLGVEVWECPLAPVHAQLVEILTTASGRAPDAWSAGQMLSVERTPVLYGAAALLQATGARSVVVGTTNRDEGAYLGFFGKASDAMVDVQAISDLHKSEVIALGRQLGLPPEILEAVPSGDVWDGRTDAEMIGASYDDVELVLRLLELGRDPQAMAGELADGAGLREAATAVERLHRINAHKYRTGGVAVHLDVMPRAVPGGWRDDGPVHRAGAAPPGLVGEWVPPPIAFDTPGVPVRRAATEVIVADGVLTGDDCDRLVSAAMTAAAQPVGVTGVVGAQGIGSVRATAFSEELAAALWARVRMIAPSVRFLGDHDPSEGHRTQDRAGHRTWRLLGLSPLLRFMRYERGGRHLCHYDAAYEYADGRRTLMSVVCFLTGDGSREHGGALRFVDDGQGDRAVWDRNHDDWTNDALPEQIIDEVHPCKGRVAIFDHRRGHDVDRWTADAPRIVIRADLVYEAIPDGRSLGEL